MTQKDVYNELRELAIEQGVTVRLETGNFEGGLCIVDEQQVILINRRHHQTRRITTLARAIFDLGIDDLHIKPALRDRIEDEVAGRVAEGGV